MKPDEILHPLIWQTAIRCMEYGWSNARIQTLIRARYNARIPSACLNRLRTDASCTDRCVSNCPMRNYIM